MFVYSINATGGQFLHIAPLHSYSSKKHVNTLNRIPSERQINLSKFCWCSIFTSLTHMHSYQSAAPWRSCCSLEAASGLQTLPALSGRRRCENVRQHLCRYSLLDCGCEENTDVFLLTWIHKIESYRRSLTTFIFCIFKHMCYSYKPFGKRTCDGEAEHAASEDTEDRPSPADKESSSQFIPADKPTNT